MLISPLLALLVILAFLLYPYVLTVWKLRQVVHYCAEYEEANPEDFPVNIAEAIYPRICELEALDFELVKYTNVYLFGREGRLPSWMLFFKDPTSSHYAYLGIIQSTHPTQLSILVELITFGKDASVLFTTSSKNYGAYEPDPGTVKQNLVDASIAELWQAHQAKLDALAISPLTLTPEAFLIQSRAYSLATAARSVKLGRFHWLEADQTYRYSLTTAIKKTWQVALLRFSNKQIGTRLVTAQDNQVDQEVKAFLEAKQPQPGMSKQKRGWIALGSLALFAAVYATRFDRNTLLAFLGTLILHEGGHLAAMLWFGYRAPAVLFIPYLGALATARKDHASLTEKVWISLAGPLPGLCLGIGIIAVQTWGHPITDLSSWYSESNFWRTASSILIGLNLFNLLPVYPLDGGQIAELLVFSRNPYLGLIYKSLGVLFLLLIGLLSPLLFAFAVIIALTIPSSFRTARWFAKLRRELRTIPWQDDEASARLVFSQLATAPKLSFAQKNSIAFGVLEARRENTAPWTSRLGLSLIYLVSLLAGFMGGIYAILPNLTTAFQVTQGVGSLATGYFQGHARYEGMMRDRVKAADQAIQTNPNDLKAYIHRGFDKNVLKDSAGALADANYVLQHDPQSREAYSLRSMIYHRMGDSAKAAADRKQVEQLIWTPKFQAAHAAIKRNPKDAKGYADRATAKHHLGDHPGALEDFNQALKLNPNAVEALLARCELYRAQSNYPAALADANRAIQLEPKNGSAYDARSAIYHATNQPEKARADEQIAEKLSEAEPPKPDSTD